MPIIILDRDGVINHDSLEYIKSPEEWIPIPDSLAAIAALNQAGYEVHIATNQSGVARGLYDTATLGLIHDKLRRSLAKVGGNIASISFCPHHPDEQCQCRKPQPGMLLTILATFKTETTPTFFIGDSHVDIKAANAAGCNPLLVLTGNGNITVELYPELVRDVPCFADLKHAVDFILKENKHV